MRRGDRRLFLDCFSDVREFYFNDDKLIQRLAMLIVPFHSQTPMQCTMLPRLACVLAAVLVLAAADVHSADPCVLTTTLNGKTLTYDINVLKRSFVHFILGCRNVAGCI